MLTPILPVNCRDAAAQASPRRAFVGLLGFWFMVLSPALLAAEPDPLRSPAWADHQARLQLFPLTFDPRVQVLAPAAAEDPMNVPVTLRTEGLPDIHRILVIADLNPIVKVLEFRPRRALARLSFRMKLQQGSPVRALAQTRDGVWHAGGTWIDTAGGGCTAPSVGRSTGSWSETLGQVDSRLFPQSHGNRVKWRVMHPMDTGLAPGIPAFYLEQLQLQDAAGEVWAEVVPYEPVSENPVFSIDFDGPTPLLRLVGRDNNGNRIDAVLTP